MSCQSKVNRKCLGTKLKANDLIQSQVEHRAFCIGFPNVYNGALVRSLLGPQTLMVRALSPFLSSGWFYFHLFSMSECHVRFHLKKLAVEYVRSAGPEQFCEAVRFAAMALCIYISETLAMKTLICYGLRVALVVIEAKQEAPQT